MNYIRTKDIYKTFILLLLPLAVIVGCDTPDYECVRCEGWACLFCLDFGQKCGVAECPVRKGETIEQACPVLGFSGEICNEEYCVAIIDEHVKCEKIDCFTLECYKGK